MREWVSVQERLPGRQGLFEIMVTGEARSLAVYDFKKSSFFIYSTQVNDVTHWRERKIIKTSA